MYVASRPTRASHRRGSNSTLRFSGQEYSLNRFSIYDRIVARTLQPSGMNTRFDIGGTTRLHNILVSIIQTVVSAN